MGIERRVGSMSGVATGQGVALWKIVLPAVSLGYVPLTGKTMRDCNNGPVLRLSSSHRIARAILLLLGLTTSSIVLGLLSACEQAPRLISLGPLPERPPVRDEDAGVDVPDGAIRCRDARDCDDGVACTQDVCLQEGYCRSNADYARCSDDVFCNGVEICDPLVGCVPPNSAETCDDLDTCTIDRCDEEAKACFHDPRDFDHDGEADVHCEGGTDCDDFDETRASSVNEVCGDLIDNDCDEVVDETDCGKTAHDTCDDALELGKGGVFEVPLLGAVDDYETGCASSADTHDVVFTFEISEPRDVKLEARGILRDGNDEIAKLSLQARCGQSSSEVQCSRSFPADLRVRALPAGRYFVIASSPASGRSLWLSFRTSPATEAPPNATCDNAVDVGAGGRFEGTFVDVGDDIQSGCGVDRQPDVFYELTLTEERDVEISAVSDEPGDLTISVRDGCEEASLVWGCRTAEPALTRLHQLPAGTYIIALEGPSTREVGYALEVAVLAPTAPPVGDGCAQPMPLVAGMSELVSLSDKQAEVASSCESTGPDAVFSLNLDRARDVLIEVDADQEVAVVALQQTCGVIATERGCRAGGPVQTRLRNVAAGDYFIVVDSRSAAAVTIKVDTLPPSATTTVTGNDDCQRAFDIPLTGGVFTGDTRTLLGHYGAGAACGANTLSPDAVYRLVLPETRRVLVTLDPSFDGVLHRMRDDRPPGQACMPWQADLCRDVAGSGIQEMLDDTLGAGTYYYVVDGARDTNAGFYTLDVSIDAP
jgi:hypothetical protein